MNSVSRSLGACARPACRHQTPDRKHLSRAYISPRMLGATRQLPAVRHALQAFTFQAPGRCLDHSADMLRGVVEGLTCDGVIQTSAPSLGQRVVRALIAPSSQGLTSLAVSADSQAVHEISARRGPLQLVTRARLAPDQGGDVYLRFHATVLLASVAHRGRHVGLLLDGNDLQSNPVMQALRAWQARSKDTRALHELTCADFQAFNQAHPELDLYQTAFRIVDLGDMLAASQARAVAAQRYAWDEPNPFVPVTHDDTTTLNAVPDAYAISPLVSPEATRALEAVLEAEPQQIERIPVK